LIHYPRFQDPAAKLAARLTRVGLGGWVCGRIFVRSSKHLTYSLSSQFHAGLDVEDERGADKFSFETIGRMILHQMLTYNDNKNIFSYIYIYTV
jgi:hypothetical protein